MRRAMRVVTSSVLCLGLVSVVAQADRGHDRNLKDASVTFHAASANPTQGLRKANLAGEVVYVSPAPVAGVMDILDTGATNDGMTLRLSGDAMDRLSRQGERVAVYIGDRLVSTAPIGDGNVSVRGLSAAQADRISRSVRGQAVQIAGPALTVVPAGLSDGLYTVDVYAQGIEDLRTYQVALQLGGGENGRLELVSVNTDKQRADYVFGTANSIDASSPRTGLLAAVLYDGSVRADAPMYLGTYGFRPTAGASGTFRVNVDLSARTILADGSNEPITFSSGADARIVIGQTKGSR